MRAGSHIRAAASERDPTCHRRARTGGGQCGDGVRSSRSRLVRVLVGAVILCPPRWDWEGVSGFMVHVLCVTRDVWRGGAV